MQEESRRQKFGVGEGVQREVRKQDAELRLCTSAVCGGETGLFPEPCLHQNPTAFGFTCTASCKPIKSLR